MSSIGENVRITLDYDFKNIAKLAYYLAKGTIVLRRFPSEVRSTKRGYHVIYTGLDYSIEKCCEMRLRLGDDEKRVFLDLNYPKKPFQTLFYQKSVYILERDSFGNVIGKNQVQ
jgi:hypothetical protein